MRDGFVAKHLSASMYSALVSSLKERHSRRVLGFEHECSFRPPMLAVPPSETRQDSTIESRIMQYRMYASELRRSRFTIGICSTKSKGGGAREDDHRGVASKTITSVALMAKVPADGAQCRNYRAVGLVVVARSLF